ncbi:hypothetical protein FACS1894188_05140 [Clostridia bacterium]|nr:hypothetical protein FACS1894188_05140 [Clostridia bacterium]
MLVSGSGVYLVNTKTKTKTPTFAKTTSTPVTNALIVQEGGGIFYGLIVGDKLVADTQYTAISYDAPYFILNKGAEQKKLQVKQNGDG